MNKILSLILILSLFGCGTGKKESKEVYLNSNAIITTDPLSQLSVTGTGSQNWNGTTSSWNVCTPTACLYSFHAENNQCLANVQACPITGGVGSKTWNGTAYNTC